MHYLSSGTGAARYINRRGQGDRRNGTNRCLSPSSTSCAAEEADPVPVAHEQAQVSTVRHFRGPANAQRAGSDTHVTALPLSLSRRPSPRE
eukprot:scaffold4058_cov257-Pinguiococcus_pyrenoidosus.AAC.4